MNSKVDLVQVKQDDDSIDLGKPHLKPFLTGGFKQGELIMLGVGTPSPYHKSGIITNPPISPAEEVSRTSLLLKGLLQRGVK